MIETLGMRLKKLREQNNLSQTDMADRLSIAKSTLCHYESDTRQPPLGTLMRIAGTFNVSTDYLLGMEKEHQINTADLNESEIEMVRQLIDWMLRERRKSNQAPGANDEGL